MRQHVNACTLAELHHEFAGAITESLCGLAGQSIMSLFQPHAAVMMLWCHCSANVEGVHSAGMSGWLTSIFHALNAVICQCTEAHCKQLGLSCRRLALKYHPDKAANSAHKAAADVVFKLITAANAVLSDSGKRTAYDTSRKRAQLYQMASSGFSMHNSCSRAHSGRF